MVFFYTATVVRAVLCLFYKFGSWNFVDNHVESSGDFLPCIYYAMYNHWFSIVLSSNQYVIKVIGIEL